MTTASLRGLLRAVHRDQRGAVSIETILIIGAVAIPILIFVLRFGWPRIKDYFSIGTEQVGIEADRVKNGG